MATTHVTPATWDVVTKAAQPGDTLRLDAGSYGDLDIRNLTFPKRVTITADPKANVRSLMVIFCDGLTFVDVNIAFTPDMNTKPNTAAIQINSSKNITYWGASITGAPAINGVEPDAIFLGDSGNVNGFPCGYGVDIVSSQSVLVAACRVSGFDHQIILNDSQRVTLAYNDLRDRRRTAIGGGGNLDGLTLDGNRISGATPFNWATASGQPGDHDHADCIALWGSCKGLRVTNNHMEQLSGANILGFWFGGDTGKWYEGFTVTGNTLLIPNAQGILASNCRNGTISNNVLIQSAVAGIEPQQRPTVLLLASAENVTVSDNRVGQDVSDRSGGKNTITGNVVLKGAVSL